MVARGEFSWYTHAGVVLVLNYIPSWRHISYHLMNFINESSCNLNKQRIITTCLALNKKKYQTNMKNPKQECTTTAKEKNQMKKYIYNEANKERINKPSTWEKMMWKLFFFHIYTFILYINDMIACLCVLRS